MPPEDPRCPACDEPVSATAGYCLHCYADLDGDDGENGDESVETAVVDFGSTSGATADSAPDAVAERDDHRGDVPGADRDGERDGNGAGEYDPGSDVDRASPSTTDRGHPGSEGTSDVNDGGWLHPDSLLDDVSTGAVGFVAGLVVGFLAMLLGLFATGSALAFLVGPVAWVGVGIYVGWTRSVFGAVRKACYLTAPTLVAVPLFWFGDAPQGGDFGGRVVAFVVSEILVLPVALLLVGVGYWLGGKAPDS